MRALHLVAIPQLTGAAEPVMDMVLGLRGLGVEVDIRIDTRRVGNFAEVLKARGIRPNPGLVLSTTAGPAAALSDWLKLKAVLRHYDVVHTHLSHDHTLAAMARGRSSRPRIIRTIHAERAFAKGMGRRFLLATRSDLITVASEQDKAALLEAQPVPADRVVVYAGSVDNARFFVDPSGRQRARNVLGLSETDFAVGSVARFQVGRRHPQMISAIAKARNERPDLKLVLIGHGETEPDLRAQVKETGLEANVLFAGYKRDDLNDYLNALDAAVWLVPGNDASSRAVLQAMAAGLPVIGGDSGAIREAIVDGETGLLVTPGDEDELSRAILQLASDHEKAKRMGDAGRQRALGEYSPVERAKRLLALYQALVEDMA